MSNSPVSWTGTKRNLVEAWIGWDSPFWMRLCGRHHKNNMAPHKYANNRWYITASIVEQLVQVQKASSLSTINVNLYCLLSENQIITMIIIRKPGNTGLSYVYLGLHIHKVYTCRFVFTRSRWNISYTGWLSQVTTLNGINGLLLLKEHIE